MEDKNKKFECICGNIYTLRYKNRHIKSKKHKRYELYIAMLFNNISNNL